MRNEKRRIGIVLLVVLACGALWLLPQAARALGGGEEDNHQWLVTPAALARTQAGDCNSIKPVCRELCINSVPSGEFMCFTS